MYMTDAVTAIFTGVPLLLLSLLAAPYLLSRAFAPRAAVARSIVTAALVAILLHAGALLGLHAAGIPITRASLAVVHLAVLFLAGAVFRVRRASFLPQSNRATRPLLLLCGVFTAAVIPFTCLAGIDTYKWVDLAMSVRVERSIPWLVHPLSLLGFTGRSYPSLQPLVLGSALILGELGVEWSFFAVSALFGILGITGAFLLGSAVHPDRRGALWFAFLYGFAPVFVRYNHWATGRGLLLALLPLFLLALLRLPTLRGIALFLLTGLLLPLSHKAGLIAVAGILLSLLAVPLLPRRGERVLVPLAALAAAAGAVLLAPNLALPFPAGKFTGCIRMAAVRFGWLLPLAAAGLCLAPGWLTDTRRRRLLPGLILTVPFSCPPHMYGALIALVFVALAASFGITSVESRLPAAPSHARRRAAALHIVLVASGALAILVHRSIGATPRRIQRAACFLEQLDPRGPYMIHCKPWRPQIQGYVSGCPRFSVARTGPVAVVFHPFPSLRGRPSNVLRRWIAHTRHLFSVTGYSVSYYGDNPRMYHVIVDGRGSPSPAAERIYDRDGVEIFRPADQAVPAGEDIR